MSDDQSTTANPERIEKRKEIQRRAKQLAADHGHNWKEMSRDDRTSFKKSVRADMKQSRKTDASE